VRKPFGSNRRKCRPFGFQYQWRGSTKNLVLWVEGAHHQLLQFLVATRAFGEEASHAIFEFQQGTQRVAHLGQQSAHYLIAQRIDALPVQFADFGGGEQFLGRRRARVL
jgi:hypothetical protein